MDAYDYNPIINGQTLEDIIKGLPNQWRSVSLLQHDGEQFINHIYAYKTTKKDGFQCMEVFREFEDGTKLGKNFIYDSYRCMCGVRYIWSRKPNWYNEYRTDDFGNCSYIDEHIFYENQLTTLDYIIEKEPELKYCYWNSHIDALTYIKIYKKHPIVEMLMKLELYHLVKNEKCLKFMEQDKTFCKYLCKNKDYIKNSLISFQILKKTYRIGKSGEQMETYNDEKKTMKSIARQLSSVLGKEIYKELKSVDGKEKIWAYANKHGQYLYRDYLNACMYFKLDLTDTKVLYPNDFKYWHDYYIKQMTEEKDEKLNLGLQKQIKEWEWILVSNDDIIMKMPKTAQEFVDEGKALHNCLGRMGYSTKMSEGKILIVFIRKAKDPDTPYVAMEFNPHTMKILQLYKGGNARVDSELENYMYNKWLKFVKSKKGKKNNGKSSRS